METQKRALVRFFLLFLSLTSIYLHNCVLDEQARSVRLASIIEQSYPTINASEQPFGQSYPALINASEQPFRNATSLLLADAQNTTTETTNAMVAACLLIKDDNDILDEWIAYHYYTLDLRYILVAIDPTSVTSPEPTLSKWRQLTDMRVQIWKDENFMPQSFLNETQTKDNLIERHRNRQSVFLGRCLRHMRRIHEKNPATFVMHVDTDEYVVINPATRSNKTLAGEQSAVLNLLMEHSKNSELRKTASFPCVTMPRRLFGSIPDGGEKNKTAFETQRWKYHAARNDTYLNGQPKVIIDVHKVRKGESMFRTPFSIHRPSRRLCRSLSAVQSLPLDHFPLVVNHYLGDWERYFSRNDTRRSATVYNSKAFVKDGRDEWILPWLDGFIRLFGDQAYTLLGKEGQHEYSNL
jgi:hypothetical protein